MNYDLNNYFENVLKTLWTNSQIEVESERTRDRSWVHKREQERERWDKNDKQQMRLSTGTLCKAWFPRWFVSSWDIQMDTSFSENIPQATFYASQTHAPDTPVSIERHNCFVFCVAFNFRHVPRLCLCVSTFDINTNARISSKQMVRHPIDITWSCFDRYNRFSQFQLWRFSCFFAHLFTRPSLVSHNFYWWWQNCIEICNSKIFRQIPFYMVFHSISEAFVKFFFSKKSERLFLSFSMSLNGFEMCKCKEFKETEISTRIRSSNENMKLQIRTLGLYTVNYTLYRAPSTYVYNVFIYSPTFFSIFVS